MVAFQFSYNKEEVISALRYHFLRRTEILVLGWALLVFFLFTLFGTFFHLFPLPVFFAVFLMIVILMVIFWYLLPFSLYTKSATFQESILLKGEEDYLSINTHFSEKRVSWNSFIQVVQTRDFLFLYRDKKSFFLIPCSGWKNEQDRSEFFQLLKKKIKDYQEK